MAPKEGAFKSGQVIADRYQVREFLGGGEVTEVYKVNDLVGNRILALKISKEAATKEIEIKLNQEYFHLSRFNHPSIVTPFDYGFAQDKRPYFTMEYFDGGPINELFKGYSEELVLVLIQVLHALDAIHNQGLIHCDIKPTNILVSRTTNKEPRVKLLDFGFAETSTTLAQIPRGTLGYIAPEVFKGIGADGRADLYSLGMVIYEVVTGKGPSAGKDLRSWLRNQYYSNFAPPQDFNPNIPEPFSNLVMRLIQRDAFRRPVSALEVIESINAWAKIPQSVIFGATRSEEGNLFLSASSFIGREEQLDGLKRKLELVKNAKGQLVFLTGERGVGKSRLLQEFKFIAKLEGATILPFTQSAIGGRPPSLIEDLLTNLKIMEPQDAVIQSTLAPDNANNLPKNKKEKSADTNLSTQDNKYQIFETVVNRLKRVANSSKIEHSLLLLIDNFELFDLASIEFLRFLGFSIENERIFIITSSLNERRVIDLAKEFSTKENFSLIMLEALSEPETEELVKSILGNFVKASELGVWLYSNTGGNPLFVIESLYSLLDSKIVRLEHGKINFDSNRLKDYRAPDTVTDTIKFRLHNLAKEEIEVLRVGATSGGPFSMEFLSAVLSYDERVLFRIIARLQAISLIRPYAKSGLGGTDIDLGNTSFVLSSKTLEAIVTEGISVAERRENHRKIALALELLYPHQQEQFLFDLAHHYNQAGLKDRAFNYCRKAGAKARQLNLTEQSLGFYENALALSTSLATAKERVELIELVGELREMTGRFNDAIDIYTQGMGIVVEEKELKRNDGYLPRLLRRLGLVCQKQGKSEEAISYFEQSLSFLKDKNTIEVINLWIDIGWSFTTLGDYKKAEKFLHEALQSLDKLKIEKTGQHRVDLAAPIRKEALFARTLYSLAVLNWYRGDANLAQELAVRSLELYETIREESYLSKVSQFLATLYWVKGDLTKAKNSYTRILPLQREKGDIYFRIRTLQGLGLVSFDIGEWYQALEYLEEAKVLCEKIGDQAGLADTLGNLGLVLEEIGDWIKAIEYYKKDIELRQSLKDDKGLAIAYVNAANILLKKGELLDAETFLKESLSFSQRLKDKQISSEYHFVMAKLETIREKYNEAGKNLAISLRLKRRTKEKRNIIERLLLSAEIRAGLMDWKKCLANCEQTQVLLTKWMNPKMTAIVSRWHGLAKSGLGFLDQGKEALKKSIDLLRSLGSKYELAISLQTKCRVLCEITTPTSEDNLGKETPTTYKPLTERELTEVSDDLREALDIFSSLGAKLNEERVKDMMNSLSQLEITRQLKGRERGEYLKVFYELSELINLNLEKEDFADRLLDLIIDVTQAERGLLFLMQGDRLYPASARNVDHTTLEDAQTISKTVIRQVKKRAEPIICADAISDPRFVSSNSVVLNKIRSLVCVPLKVENKVIGTIYLDSRINPNVFVDDDKNLLISVANLLAATIDRSFAFKKMQDDFSALREDILTDAVTGYFLGRSKAIKDVYQVIEQIASTDCNVLLLGETGSGKGVLARLIHANSNRRANKLVSINCGTLPETLFESELFGHAKGSFTGAIRDKEGLFEIAEHGTIFMDEITNTTLGIQAKLLEVLEDKIIRRVGETETRRVDVRLICATNKDLEKEVKEGRFREDLYYRLNVVTIHVPPLRERISDIMLLASYFLKRYAKQLNKPILGFEDDVPQVIVQYNWPGNVRELQNVIERSVIMAQKRKITLENFGPKFEALAKTMKLEEKGQKKSLEKEQVIEALKVSQGNVSRAAQLLSTHRRQLQRLLKRYGIDKEQFHKQI